MSRRVHASIDDLELGSCYVSPNNNAPQTRSQMASRTGDKNPPPRRRALPAPARKRHRQQETRGWDGGGSLRYSITAEAGAKKPVFPVNTCSFRTAVKVAARRNFRLICACTLPLMSPGGAFRKGFNPRDTWDRSGFRSHKVHSILDYVDAETSLRLWREVSPLRYSASSVCVCAKTGNHTGCMEGCCSSVQYDGHQS